MTCKILKYSLNSLPGVKTFQCEYIDQNNINHLIKLSNNFNEDRIDYIKSNEQKEFDHYFVDEPKEIQDIVEKMKFFDYDIPINKTGITVYKEDNDGSNNE